MNLTKNYFIKFDTLNEITIKTNVYLINLPTTINTAWKYNLYIDNI